MSKETKISLLIGLFAILTIGIFVSDHLSETKKLPIAEVAVSTDGTPPPPAPMAHTGSNSSNPNASYDSGNPLPPPGTAGTNNNPNARTIPIPHAEPRDNITPSDLRNIDRSGNNTSPIPGDNSAPPADSNPFSNQPGDLDTGRLPTPMPPVDNAANDRATPPPPANDTPDHSLGVNLTNPKVHFVVKGDTLSSIAQKYLGSIKYQDEIFQANKGILKNPSSLGIGVRLIIPEKLAPTNSASNTRTPPADVRPPTPSDSTPNFPQTPIHARPRSAVADSTPTDAPAAPKTVEYTVKKGDTLWSIAERISGSGKFQDKIIELNRIRNANKLKEGVVLRVPSKFDR